MLPGLAGIAGFSGGSSAPIIITADEHDFSYTGAYEEYTVPAGVNNITLLLWGGGGGGGAYSSNNSHGGPGGVVQASFTVSTGDTLKVEIGQGGRGGVTSTSGGVGGWPDGGGASRGDVCPGGGGGSSRFYINGTLMAVSGGGGGGGWGNGAFGGPGGGTTGGTGYSNQGGTIATYGGSGGTQSAVGVCLGAPTEPNKKGRSLVSFPGAQRTGGWGGSTADTTTSTGDDGGGGGGGYYGGGGGGGDGLMGGGGSSYVDAGATGVTHWQSGQVATAFLPEGTSGIGIGGKWATSGTATNGGNGFARIITHDGTATAGVVGKTTSNNDQFDIVASEKTCIPITFSGSVWVREIQLGLRSGATSGADFRGVIYSSPGGSGVAQSTDALIATTAVYTTVSGDNAQMIRMVFSSPLNLAAGNYWIGYHAGAGTADAVVSGGAYRLYGSDTYSDGTASTFGNTNTFTGAPKIVVPYTSYDPT